MERNSRGQYCKISLEKQAAIAHYALENENKSATRFFSKQLDIAVKTENENNDNKNLFLSVLKFIKKKFAPAKISRYTSILPPRYIII